MTLPEVDSIVYGVLAGSPHDPRTHVVPARVTLHFPNENGVVGPWFVCTAWDRAYALRDENVTWTRSSDPAAHQALLAAHALLHSC